MVEKDKDPEQFPIEWNKSTVGTGNELPPEMTVVRCCKCNGVGTLTYHNPEWVRAARKRCGVGMRQLAKQIGISAAYLSDVERGRRYCSDRIAQAVRAMLATLGAD